MTGEAEPAALFCPCQSRGQYFDRARRFMLGAKSPVSTLTVKLGLHFAPAPWYTSCGRRDRPCPPSCGPCRTWGDHPRIRTWPVFGTPPPATTRVVQVDHAALSMPPTVLPFLGEGQTERRFRLRHSLSLSLSAHVPFTATIPGLLCSRQRKHPFPSWRPNDSWDVGGERSMRRERERVSQTKATFGLPLSKKRQYCRTHRKRGMIDLHRPSCGRRRVPNTGQVRIRG